MDIFTKTKRSQIMSKIRGKDTGLEERAWMILKQSGLRFRKHPRGILGKPDAANKSKKLAVFIDSEFWHGFDWRNRKKLIKSNRKFWKKKIERNIARDKEVNRVLRAEGWKVIRIWEYELAQKNLSKIIQKLQKLQKNR